MRTKKWKALIGTTAMTACLMGGAAMAQEADVNTSPPDYDTQRDMDENTDVDVGIGGSPQNDMTTPQSNIDVDVNTQAPAAATDTTVQTDTLTRRERRRIDDKALIGDVKIGGGMEGQAGALRGQLSEGPMWSAAAEVQAMRFVGLEAMYSGSVHEFDSEITGGSDIGNVGGADLVRNGGQVAATINAPTRYVQPYLLGGIGFDRYSFRGDNTGAFSDDTAGRVPLGVGLKATAGNFIADLRGNYNVLFNQDFLTNIPGADADASGATYDVGLQVGARF